MKLTTPERLTSLPPNNIFVFGSNIHGMHEGGAARIAYRRFGAEWGVGEGLVAQTYALPTMEGPLAFEAASRRFIAMAATRHDLTFWLTKVGCGIAGYDERQVKHWFAAAPLNVIKPPRW